MEPVAATPGDVQKLSKFIRQAWREAGSEALGFTGATEETIEEISSESFLKERLSNPNVKIYFVKAKEEILGFASTRKFDESTVELSGIVVLESATGKGIGTKLFEKAVSSASLVGARKMMVKTEALNQKAISFYVKMGLTEIKRTTESVEGRAVDVVILEKALT